MEESARGPLFPLMGALQHSKPSCVHVSVCVCLLADPLAHLGLPAYQLHAKLGGALQHTGAGRHHARPAHVAAQLPRGLQERLELLKQQQQQKANCTLSTHLATAGLAADTHTAAPQHSICMADTTIKQN